MTSERLYNILKLADSLDQNLGVQSKLEAVVNALQNVASQPSQPQYQTTLSSALKSFLEAVTQMPPAIDPSQAAAIREMGGEDFFEPSLGEKVDKEIQIRAMTPAVARDFVQDLASRRAAFLETVRNAKRSLEKLRIKESTLEPGTADVAFLIPRDLFNNQLGSFARELNFISRLVQEYTEARTGISTPVTLEQLSSSIPTVTLLADPHALELLAHVISLFLNAWKKIEEIREVRGRLAKMGMKGTALKELDEQVETTITTTVEESTTYVMKDYSGGRKNELDGFVRHDTRQLFGQIERGLNVEFRAEPKPDANEATQQLLQGITNVAKELKFPAPTDEPLLLNAAQVLEDETGSGAVVVQHVTKTRTEKTTSTSKKHSSES
jgi:hypothetical protein